MKRKLPSSPLLESFSNKSNLRHCGFNVIPLPITFPNIASSSGPLSSPENPLTTPFHSSFSDPENPSSKNLKIIKEFIKETNQLMHEEEELCDYDDHKNLQNETEINDGGGNQEVVSVEKCGNKIVIHFNCPCGRSHRIFQAGKNLYYNLI